MGKPLWPLLLHIPVRWDLGHNIVYSWQFLQLETAWDVGLLSQNWESKLLLHSKTEKPVTAEGRVRGAASGKYRDEPWSGEPTGPCRRVRKMSQEARNMLL